MLDSKTLFTGFNRRILLGLLYSIIVCTPAAADDIDVFTTGVGTFKPNILFVLDYSGSMGYDINGAETSTTGLASRESILETAVENVLDNNADRINAGLSLFSWTSSGIKWPVSELSAHANSVDSNIPVDDTLRSKDIINSILGQNSADGGTATVAALAEAALYFRGANVANGGQDVTDADLFEPDVWNVANRQYEGGYSLAPNPVTYTPQDAHVGSWSPGASYISPITDQCQKNFVILISDGEPTQKQWYPDIESVVGSPFSSCEDLSNTIFVGSTGTSDHGNCGPEIAWELSNNDQIDTISDSTVKTYTVGFNVDGAGQNYLRRIATEGKGEFFPAENPVDLNDALEKILDEILESNESFAELSIDVDKATFANENKAYFPLFTPSLRRAWAGNLKGYFIDSDGIKDTNNVLATVTDASGTKFTDTSQSFWSATADGDVVVAGGASAKLSGATRTLYTYTGGAIAIAGVALNRLDDAHDLSVANNALTHTMLGIDNDATKRAELINWLHTSPMGDPLHARSVTIKYANKTVVYAMTNQGLLHAIDATKPASPTTPDHTGGEELFAFMPPELLSNLDALRTNDRGKDHIYGLDGNITRWHEDLNNDGIVNNSDSVLLIFGMRRGGQNYYALDVTDPADPVYKWKIEGGTGDFAKLGQSWSRMSLVDVINDSSAQRVLVFGGGYDATVDAATQRSEAEGTGNTIFMIDKDGNHLWSASHSDMDYSIPSDLTVIDSNDDGIADRIYAGDVGGMVWRVDFGDVGSTSNFTINKLADVGGSAFQPFFYPPSVSINTTGLDKYIAVVLGSGNRTNPLDATSTNRLYMLRDNDVDAGAPVAASFSTMMESNLYDVTDNTVESSDEDEANAAKEALANASGWYLRLTAGEKSLSAPITFQGKIFATTFSPLGSGAATGNCTVASTEGRYYTMRVSDARPVKQLNDPIDPDRALTSADRSKVISTTGIPTGPVAVLSGDNSTAQIFADNKPVDSDSQNLERVLWFQQK